MTGLAKLAPYSMLMLSGLMGGASLLGLTVFLYVGSFTVLDLDLGASSALGLDTLLCMAFFIQHSGMIRKSSRRRWAMILPPYYYSALYTVASGVVLLGLLVFWQNPSEIVVSLQGPFRWLLRALFFVSIGGFAWGVWALGSFDAFGLQPILAHLRRLPMRSMPFVVRGPYRWVRHPLYLFSLGLIWSCPDISMDRLLFNVLWTAWIVVGTILEERDLVGEVGEAYEEYQGKVPMLIPWRVPPAP